MSTNAPLQTGGQALSDARQDWWGQNWRPAGSMAQPRVAVLQHAMNTTSRLTNPAESIASGYMRNRKFHDREPHRILETIREIDSDFFNTYPRMGKTPPTLDDCKAWIGEAAAAFYKQGRDGYGKPGLRKDHQPATPPLPAM